MPEPWKVTGQRGDSSTLLLIHCGAILPPLLLMRAVQAARRKGLGREMWRATPHLLAFYVIWALGESVGALRGPGNALAMIE